MSAFGKTPAKARGGGRLGIIGEVAELALGTGGALGLSGIELGRRRGEHEKGGGRAAPPREREDRERIAGPQTITLTLTREEAELVLRALTGGGR